MPRFLIIFPLRDQSDSALPTRQSQNCAAASARGRSVPSFPTALSAHLRVDRILSRQLRKFRQCLPDSAWGARTSEASCTIRVKTARYGSAVQGLPGLRLFGGEPSSEEKEGLRKRLPTGDGKDGLGNPLSFHRLPASIFLLSVCAWLLVSSEDLLSSDHPPTSISCCS